MRHADHALQITGIDDGYFGTNLICLHSDGIWHEPWGCAIQDWFEEIGHEIISISETMDQHGRILLWCIQFDDDGPVLAGRTQYRNTRPNQGDEEE